MPIPRRIIALLVSSIFSFHALAQSAPADAPAGDKLTLNEAIQRALAKNFSIKVQGFDAAIAAAGVTEALGKFDPVLSASYNTSTSEAPSLIDSGTGIRPVPSTTTNENYDFGLNGLLPWGMTYQLGGNRTNTKGTLYAYADNFSTFGGVSGTQPLLRNFGFGPTLASIRIAQANHHISEWQFRQGVIDMITNVTFAYNELTFAYANLRSALRARELAASLVDENEKRFKVGNVSEYDVTSARSRMAIREEGILFAEQNVRVSENALKQLITDVKTPALLSDHIAIETLPIPPIVVVDPAVDFHLALEKRPDYQEAKLVLKRNSINTRLQRNQLLPRVDLVGSYGYSGLDSDPTISRRQVTNEDYHSYSWGVVVSVPVTFTTERGRYRAAKLQQRQSETQLELVEQDIVVKVGNAASQIETAQKRIAASRRARELAQSVLDAEVKRLRAGQSTTFFVAQEQEILSSLEVSESRAQVDYRNALADYDRQLGITLEKLNVKIDPPK